jgi:hypothetical protein
LEYPPPNRLGDLLAEDNITTSQIDGETMTKQAQLIVRVCLMIGPFQHLIGR